jgi:hypothetical protein
MWAKYSKYYPVVQLLQTTIFQFFCGKKELLNEVTSFAPEDRT